MSGWLAVRDAELQIHAQNGELVRSSALTDAQLEHVKFGCLPQSGERALDCLRGLHCLCYDQGRSLAPLHN